MTRRQIECYALRLISPTKWNCAETVLLAGAAHLGLDLGEAAPRLATCFGGGVGATQEELCGALAGGVMALGLVYGRNTSGAPCQEAYKQAALFREMFVDRHGASACHVLRERFGEQRDWEHCRELVGLTAGLLWEVLAENGPPSPKRPLATRRKAR